MAKIKAKAKKLTNKELQEKYGDVIVNINNGSLKPKENEQVNTKN